MWFDPVGSTTWPNRHAVALGRLREYLPTDHPPIIVNIGPGAVTQRLQPWLTDAATQATRVRRGLGDLARRADGLLRRLPWARLVSLEPVEISQQLGGACELVVVDRSRRVLAAVQRHLPAARCLQIDIGQAGLPLTADVIIAFNIVCRLRTPQIGARHVLAALKPGGILLMDDRSVREFVLPIAALHSLGDKTYRREA